MRERSVPYHRNSTGAQLRRSIGALDLLEPRAEDATRKPALTYSTDGTA